MFPVGVFALFQQPGEGPRHAELRMVEMVAGIPFESGLDTVRPDPLHHFGGAGVHPAHQRMACAALPVAEGEIGFFQAGIFPAAALRRIVPDIIRESRIPEGAGDTCRPSEIPCVPGGPEGEEAREGITGDYRQDIPYTELRLHLRDALLHHPAQMLRRQPLVRSLTLPNPVRRPGRQLVVQPRTRIVDGYQHHRRTVLQPVVCPPHILAVAPERVDINHWHRTVPVSLLIFPDSIFHIVQTY